MKESEMTPQRPDETTLHAWADGELAPEAAASVAQWLAEHPDEAARMAAIQAQTAGLQALHAQVLDDPVPQQLMQALRRPPVPWRWQHALAAGLLLCTGLGLGYDAGLYRADSAASAAALSAHKLPDFVREAAAAHVVYVPEQRHPVEVAAQQQAHLVQWLSKRLGVALKPPVLEAQGFHLMGGRLLPGQAGQARAQFMYEDGNAQRVTLYVSVLNPQALAASAPAAFQWSSDGVTQGFYWIEGRQGYALSSTLPRQRLQPLANIIYQQLQ